MASRKKAPAKPKAVHVMLDLETLSTDANAHILSIGAVAFHPLLGIERRFHVGLFNNDPRAHVDVHTVSWWFNKDQDLARDELNRLEKVDYLTALEGFALWLNELGGEVRIWGNGAAFDNVILANAYRRAGMEVPWKFYNDRCYRTLKTMAPTIKILQDETVHNALSDAVMQALHLVRIVKKMKWDIN